MTGKREDGHSAIIFINLVKLISASGTIRVTRFLENESFENSLDKTP
jgi:hypothetical protein